MAGVTYREELISAPTYDLDVLDYFEPTDNRYKSEVDS